jgi:hypothetical protein
VSHLADLDVPCRRGGEHVVEVVDGRGNTYVNNPGFDLVGGEEPKPA